MATHTGVNLNNRDNRATGSEISSPSPTNIFEFIDPLAKLVATCSLLAYATGFLIVYTFLDTYGIRAASVDFFKAKYIYVGALYLLFPLGIILPLLLLTRIFGKLKAVPPHPSRKKPITAKHGIGAFRPRRLGAGLLLNLFAVFCVVISFAPHKFFATWWQAGSFTFVFAVCIAGMILSHYTDKSIHTLRKRIRYWRKTAGQRTESILTRLDARLATVQREIVQAPTFLYRVRVAIFWCVLIPEGIILVALWGQLWEMFWQGAYEFLLTMLLAYSLIPIAFTRWENFKKENSPIRYLYIAFICCLLGTLYYLGVITYAHRVYPYMPARRGGGDFTETTLAQLHLKTPKDALFPRELIDTNAIALLKTDTNVFASATARPSPQFQPSEITYPLVIIDETAISIFVATTNSAGGPNNWRKKASAKPYVYEIPRDLISMLIYLNQTNFPPTS